MQVGQEGSNRFLLTTLTGSPSTLIAAEMGVPGSIVQNFFHENFADVGTNKFQGFATIRYTMIHAEDAATRRSKNPLRFVMLNLFYPVDFFLFASFFFFSSSSFFFFLSSISL
jgi:hypothetical protein